MVKGKFGQTSESLKILRPLLYVEILISLIRFVDLERKRKSRQQLLKILLITSVLMNK